MNYKIASMAVIVLIGVSNLAFAQADVQQSADPELQRRYDAMRQKQIEEYEREQILLNSPPSSANPMPQYAGTPEDRARAAQARDQRDQHCSIYYLDHPSINPGASPAQSSDYHPFTEPDWVKSMPPGTRKVRICGAGQYATYTPIQ